MENHIFYEKFTMKSLLNFVKKELSTDYDRMKTWCSRRILSNEAQMKVLELRNVANMTEGEILEEISALRGENRALEAISNYIETRKEGVDE